MTQAIGHKVFSDYAARKRWVDLYEMMDPKDQQDFSERVRKLFDSKVTSLEDLNDFYINIKDVDRCFHEMKAAQNA